MIIPGVPRIVRPAISCGPPGGGTDGGEEKKQPPCVRQGKEGHELIRRYATAAPVIGPQEFGKETPPLGRSDGNGKGRQVKLGEEKPYPRQTRQGINNRRHRLNGNNRLAVETVGIGDFFCCSVKGHDEGAKGLADAWRQHGQWFSITAAETDAGQAACSFAHDMADRHSGKGRKHGQAEAENIPAQCIYRPDEERGNHQSRKDRAADGEGKTLPCPPDRPRCGTGECKPPGSGPSGSGLPHRGQRRRP